MRYRLFWLAAFLALAADLFSKQYVFSWVLGGMPPLNPELGYPPPKIIFSGWLEFALHYNRGAVWGVGQGRTGILIGLTSLIIPAVVLMAYSCRAQKAPLWALGLLLGGAAGNLYDRIFEPGVRDFIHVLIRYNDRTWPIFNLADSAIVVGVIWWATWSMFFAPAEEAEKTLPDDAKNQNAEETNPAATKTNAPAAISSSAPTTESGDTA